MTIKEYEEQNPEWDIYEEFELGFVEPSNTKEAHENLDYVISEFFDTQTVAIVVRSYYAGTIEWDSL